MTVHTFTHNPFPTNGYVVYDGGAAALVDAPSSTAEERRAVTGYVEAHDLRVEHLLLTHAHIDHIFGCAPLAEHFGLAWKLHPADRPFLERAKEQATAFGVALQQPPAPGDPLGEGDRIAVGAATLDVVHTPGHSPGSVSFIERGAGIVLSGDVLFRGSIGRVQGLPQTSLPQLLQSIEEKLLPLDDDARVYPGHGEATTIGRERSANPFLNDELAGRRS